MDEGLPIAYPLLERGVPVYAADGSEVGTVDHVVAAEQQDIFHGIVLKRGEGRHFVPAENVASLHEHGVDLRLTPEAVAALPSPHGAAPVYRDIDPGAAPSTWRKMLDRLELRNPRDRNWRREE
ncbi:MAG TPA: DUF2171 domain-containing protein [Solirubrobacteraceae bacterium]|nr:DUF2171 domain-containing protein [Solirubrobacteraceae bacterium]